MAIPDYRIKPAGKNPIITFEERPAGSPEGCQGVVLSRRELWPRLRISEAEGNLR